MWQKYFNKIVNRYTVIGFLVVIVLFVTGCVLLPQVQMSDIDFNGKLIPKDSAAVGENGKAVFQQAFPTDGTQYENYFKDKIEVPKSVGEIKGGIVPHHLLAGKIPATFFDYLKKQDPSVVVLVSPNHFGQGGAYAISGLRDWETPFGILSVDKKNISILANKNLIKINESAFVGEHGIASVVPFIKKALPDTKVLPIILAYKTNDQKIDNILQELYEILPKDAVFVSSIDFSHYQTFAVANFHDETTISAIKNFDFERLNKLEIDSEPSLYFVMKAMEHYGTQKIAFELKDNSANIAGDAGVEQTTSYYSPYFVKGETEKENTGSILHFGDMMLDRNVKKVLDNASTTDYLFEKLAGEENRFFLGMDEVGANLEGPFANTRRTTTKEIAFRFDPIFLPMLKKYNFSIFSCANNHTYDMSAAGFEESKNNLRAAGFDFYGVQYKINDNSLLIKQVGDYKIGFIGVNDTNSPVDEDKIKELIQKAKIGGSKYIILNIHWGEEYKEISNVRQKKLAHEMIDAGVDVVIGHHPHVVQEMEIYNNHPIFYSLGNFVFDQYFSVPTQQGLAIGLVFKDKQISVYVFPLEGKKSQVSQMPYAKRIEYFNDWLEKSRLGDINFDNFNLKINL